MGQAFRGKPRDKIKSPYFFSIPKERLLIGARCFAPVDYAANALTKLSSKERMLYAGIISGVPLNKELTYPSCLEWGAMHKMSKHTVRPLLDTLHSKGFITLFNRDRVLNIVPHVDIRTMYDFGFFNPLDVDFRSEKVIEFIKSFGISVDQMLEQTFKYAGEYVRKFVKKEPTLYMESAGKNACEESVFRARNPFLGARNPFLGARNPFLLTRNPLLCARNPFLGARNPFLGARNPENDSKNANEDSWFTGRIIEEQTFQFSNNGIRVCRLLNLIPTEIDGDEAIAKKLQILTDVLKIGTLDSNEAAAELKTAQFTIYILYLYIIYKIDRDKDRDARGRRRERINTILNIAFSLSENLETKIDIPVFSNGFSRLIDDLHLDPDQLDYESIKNSYSYLEDFLMETDAKIKSFVKVRHSKPTEHRKKRVRHALESIEEGQPIHLHT